MSLLGLRSDTITNPYPKQTKSKSTQTAVKVRLKIQCCKPYMPFQPLLKKNTKLILNPFVVFLYIYCILEMSFTFSFDFLE